LVDVVKAPKKLIGKVVLESASLLVKKGKVSHRRLALEPLDSPPPLLGGEVVARLQMPELVPVQVSLCRPRISWGFNDLQHPFRRRSA